MEEFLPSAHFLCPDFSPWPTLIGILRFRKAPVPECNAWWLTQEILKYILWVLSDSLPQGLFWISAPHLCNGSSCVCYCMCMYDLCSVTLGFYMKNKLPQPSKQLFYESFWFSFVCQDVRFGNKTKVHCLKFLLLLFFSINKLIFCDRHLLKAFCWYFNSLVWSMKITGYRNRDPVVCVKQNRSKQSNIQSTVLWLLVWKFCLG